MKYTPLASSALLALVLTSLSATPSEADIVLRRVRAREVLDPIGYYEADLVLTGLPGTFINGSNNPAERDFVTVFDIPDLEGDVDKPVGWTSRNVLGPLGLPPSIDDPILPNLTFSYLPGEPLRLPDDSSALPIGTFSWQTFDVNPLILLSELHFYWQTSRRLPTGEVIKETGFGTAPVRIDIIPEPASLAMLATGLGLITTNLRSRRKRALQRA